MPSWSSPRPRAVSPAISCRATGPTARKNQIRFQRLKDKLGNKSNASSEVEFHGAYAERVGAEGAGVRTIIEMVNLTRLDCAIASAGQSRIALSQALHHIRNRSVFQRKLADQPSMRATVADLALELEAQVALVFRLCRASERAHDDPAEAAYVRLLTPAVKFLVCKSTPQLVYESLECLGGNGYTEDLPLARYFRESPLNAIWEGSGNVMALDVLRAAGRHPDQAMATVTALAKTAAAAFDVRPLAETLAKILQSGDAERRARFLCEGLAKIAALAALAEAKSDFATLYGDTRLNGARFAQFGTADLGSAEQALDGSRLGGLSPGRQPNAGQTAAAIETVDHRVEQIPGPPRPHGRARRCRPRDRAASRRDAARHRAPNRRSGQWRRHRPGPLGADRRHSPRWRSRSHRARHRANPPGRAA